MHVDRCWFDVGCALISKFCMLVQLNFNRNRVDTIWVNHVMSHEVFTQIFRRFCQVFISKFLELGEISSTSHPPKASEQLMADSNFVPWMAVVVWHKNMLIRFGILSWSKPRLGFVHKNHCQVNMLNCVFPQ